LGPRRRRTRIGWHLDANVGLAADGSLAAGQFWAALRALKAQLVEPVVEVATPVYTQSSVAREFRAKAAILRFEEL
jgi:hypothetical protein